MARLAELQLHEAVGELAYQDGVCTEAPDAQATELSVFAVAQMAVMAKRFEDLFFRLRREAVSAGHPHLSLAV
jgi:hypothetical protein